MSEMNGNRSRFHRLRKQKIARRKRTSQLLMDFGGQRKLATGGSTSKTKATIA
jgi:hypothetical protein